MDPVSKEIIINLSDSLTQNKNAYTMTINQIVENAKTKINANAAKFNTIGKHSLIHIKPIFNFLNEDLIFKVKQYKTSSKTISLFKGIEGYAIYLYDRRIFRTDYIPETVYEYCSLIDRQLAIAYYDYINNYKIIMNSVKDSGISINMIKFYLKNGFIPDNKTLNKGLFKRLCFSFLKLFSLNK